MSVTGRNPIHPSGLPTLATTGSRAPARLEFPTNWDSDNANRVATHLGAQIFKKDLAALHPDDRSTLDRVASHLAADIRSLPEFVAGYPDRGFYWPQMIQGPDSPMVNDGPLKLLALVSNVDVLSALLERLQRGCFTFSYQNSAGDSESHPLLYQFDPLAAQNVADSGESVFGPVASGKTSLLIGLRPCFVKTIALIALVNGSAGADSLRHFEHANASDPRLSEVAREVWSLTRTPKAWLDWCSPAPVEEPYKPALTKYLVDFSRSIFR